jgi:hypothetical protein
MGSANALTAELAQQLAAHGGVSLAADRAGVVAEVFSEVIAPELARVMAAEVDPSPAVMFHVETVEAGFAHPLTAQGR